MTAHYSVHSRVLAALFLLVLLVLLVLLATFTASADPLADSVATELGVEELSPAQLDILEEVVARYRAPATAPVLDPRALDGILDGVDRAVEEVSLWDRFWEWLVEKLQELGLDVDPAGSGPAEVPRWVLELITLALVVTVLAVIVNELRLRQWRRRVRPAPVGGADASQTGSVVLSLDDVPGLPPREQPGAVLRIVLAALATRGVRLGGEGATHREIAAGAKRLGDRLGLLLGRLARLAEVARYSRTDRGDQGEALDAGRGILDALPEGRSEP